MLEINKLNVKIKDNGENILKDFSLNINDGEIHVIMGPNGTGKSTLSKVIMGHYKYEVISGDIIFNGKKINKLTTDERAKLGLFLCMQDPTVIEGVSNSEFLKTALGEITGEKVNLFSFIKGLESSMEEVSLDSSMLHRSLNSGFSAGEKKKNEILQMKTLKPKFIILDELDSGLDVDSLRIICDNINSYIKDNPNTSILIITHYSKILEYLKPDFVHIMMNGNIKQTGDLELSKKIEKYGYSIISENDKDE